jgi:hypothetical protein
MCFRHIGGHQQTTMLQREMVECLPLNQDWDRWLDLHGQGYTVKYPIRISKILKRSPQSYFIDDGSLRKSDCVICEWITMDFVKELYVA